MVNKLFINEFVHILEDLNMDIVLSISDKIDFSQEVVRLAQKNSEYSVIDYRLVLNKEEFIKNLRYLRVKCPDMEIIILAGNLKPGSKILQKIVHLGIYNIIIKNSLEKILKEFLYILKTPKKYSDVIAFDINEEDSDSFNQRNIIEHKYMGSKMIGVIGGQQGIGVTHFLITMASYLRKNSKVAYIELNNSGDIKSLGKTLCYITEESKNKFRYKGVDFYWKVELLEFLNSYKNRYEYILVDFGSKDRLMNIDYFKMMDFKICMVSGIDWKISGSKKIYDEFSKIDLKKQWIYVVPFIKKSYIKDLNRYIKNSLRIYPYNENPFKLGKDARKFFQMMLQMDPKSEDKIIKFRRFLNGIW